MEVLRSRHSARHALHASTAPSGQAPVNVSRPASHEIRQLHGYFYSATSRLYPDDPAYFDLFEDIELTDACVLVYNAII